MRTTVIEEDDVTDAEQTARQSNGDRDADVPATELKPRSRDPATIPPRQFLYGKHLIRKNISAGIGAGGRLKTTTAIFEAIEMAVGYNLTTREPLPNGPLRVMGLNAEEDQDELDRRVAAICQRYEISEAERGGRLFIKSVRDRPLRFATLVRGMPTLNHPALKALTDLIEQHNIDVFMLDPWVSFHRVNESSNADMDLVIKEGLGVVASKTNSAGKKCSITPASQSPARPRAQSKMPAVLPPSSGRSVAPASSIL